ncbi:hypothetical protein K490DRAFT_59464 [Saccharata proteae CBS 121410]|uniref:Uncharacterized protein n=1 Tax=Saccharata proteae CBS 121410 TaxID=1314787 RepID=A0A9P4HSU7_9PEZI|nr:hypothetical protein K490DRAFT_59464 [Saccharata proteae CBS 121410]
MRAPWVVASRAGQLHGWRIGHIRGSIISMGQPTDHVSQGQSEDIYKKPQPDGPTARDGAKGGLVARTDEEAGAAIEGRVVMPSGPAWHGVGSRLEKNECNPLTVPQTGRAVARDCTSAPALLDRLLKAKARLARPEYIAPSNSSHERSAKGLAWPQSQPNALYPIVVMLPRSHFRDIQYFLLSPSSEAPRAY